jgi:hypothetical protein
MLDLSNQFGADVTAESFSEWVISHTEAQWGLKKGAVREILMKIKWRDGQLTGGAAWPRF